MDENMNEWENCYYGTGPTKPKKNHGLLLAILLVMVIFLSGVVSILSILNIRLFQKLNQPREKDLPISFAVEPEAVVPETTEATLPADSREDLVIALETSPVSRENIPEEGGLSLQEIYSRNIDSVVSISTQTPGGTATGTGVIISPRGHIITNHHVIENALNIGVQLTDSRKLTAEVVGADAVSDLAVLQITAENLHPATFGDSEKLRVGDTVVAIGDPLGEKLRGTMTNGIVSAINRDVNLNGLVLNLIQTNAALNSGNSGGPLINCYGQVVGINTMKIGAFADVAGVEGIGFAIPSSTVKSVVEQLITNGYVAGRPTLGLSGEILSTFYQRYFRMPSGLYITQVDAEGPAGKAGIIPGDLLLKLNGTHIYSQTDLNAFLYSCHVGDTVEAEVYREGYVGTVTLVLEESRGK